MEGDPEEASGNCRDPLSNTALSRARGRIRYGGTAAMNHDMYTSTSTRSISYLPYFYKGNPSHNRHSDGTAIQIGRIALTMDDIAP